MNKKDLHVILGLDRDSAESKIKTDSAVDALNIRITTRGDSNNGYVIHNEKGTLKLIPSWEDINFRNTCTEEEFEYLNKTTIPFVIVGHIVLNNQLVLFLDCSQNIIQTTYNSMIMRYTFSKDTDVLTIKRMVLYRGNLGFDYKHPIEAIGVYEKDNLQKVYWVDGIHQTRMLNIAVDKEYNSATTHIDFAPEVILKHTMEVIKNNTGGSFSAGTVQYAFSYFNKFHQESKIVEQSPLYYLSPKNRGLKADTISNCSFHINLKGLDTTFDYVRLYAIVRSSENATTQCRVVGDYSIPKVSTPYQLGVKHLLPKDPHNTNKRKTILDTNLDNIKMLDLLTGNVDDFNHYNPQELSTSILGGSYLETDFYFNRTDLGDRYVLYDASSNTIYYPDSQGLNLTVYAPSGSTVKKATYVQAEYSASYIKTTTKGGITIIDTGTYGYTIDATALLFIGGENFIAKHIAQKDNTLFLGNIKQVKKLIGTIPVKKVPLQDYTTSQLNTNQNKVLPATIGYEGVVDKVSYNPSDRLFGNYDIDNNRSSYAVKRFKFGENYRLGYIAQYKDGSWSDVLYLGDYDQTQVPVLHAENTADDSVTYSTGTWKYKLDSNTVAALKAEGFRRVAPVVVYPLMSDRKVICQGLLSPTVYNVKDRMTNSPYAQASWYFRFTNENYINANNGYHSVNSVERHNMSLTAPVGLFGGNDEVQNNFEPYLIFPYIEYKDNGTVKKLENSKFAEYFKEYFYMDCNILTFNSPEIEVGEELKESDFENCSLRIIGATNISNPLPIRMTGNNADKMLQKELNYSTNIYCTTKSVGLSNDAQFLKDVDFTRYAGGYYVDSQVDVYDSENLTPFKGQSILYGWKVYPWHRNGSLNNQDSLTSGQLKNAWRRTAELQYKKWANIYYGCTEYFDEIQRIDDNYNQYSSVEPAATINTKSAMNVAIETPQLFNSDQTELIKINTSGGMNKALLYYGNIDKVLTYNNIDLSSYEFVTKSYKTLSTEKRDLTCHGANKTQGYPIKFEWFKVSDSNAPTIDPFDTALSAADYWILNNHQYTFNEILNHGIFIDSNSMTWWENNKLQLKNGNNHSFGEFTRTEIFNADAGVWSRDPISMKYKSTPHLVLKFKDNGKYSFYLRTATEDIVWEDKHSNFWEDENTKKTYVGVGNDIKYAGLYIGELYRVFTKEELDARFGGNSKEAISNNIWHRCGEAVDLDETNVEIVFKEGDTYLERYDCLKTKPFTNEDPNSIIEILSTEVESRVHLDERVDRNRFLKDNTFINAQNFNQFNLLGYNQSNNYFTYAYLDTDKYSTPYFPNMITWSLEKVLGEEIDKWCSIDLTNTIDLEGNKGENTAIRTFNSELYAFQDNGIVQLLFNSRVQIPTSDGQPIEITNGLKMQGLRYISNTIGCINKYSICSTTKGLYFLDSNSKYLYRLGNGIENLSVAKGMSSYFKDMNNFSLSNYNTFNYIFENTYDVALYYDEVYSDIYIVGNKEALCYSEILERFTSRFSYGTTSFFGNILDSTFAIYDTDIYECFRGEYNTIYDVVRPFSISFISNDNSIYNKIFNTLDIRSYYADNMDDRNKETVENYDKKTFDNVEITTERQHSSAVLRWVRNHPSNLQKKFNVWNVILPRDSRQNNGKLLNYHLNRMNGTWAKITLSSSQTNNMNMGKFTLHDIGVNYNI